MKYSEARDKIRDLDIIAFEGRGFFSRIVSLFTGGKVTHVGLAAWWGKSLMLIESREFRGGRAIRLSREIPEQGVLLYRVAADYSGLRKLEALELAKRATGAGYDWRGIFGYARRLPVLKLIVPKARIDGFNDGNRFCSELVSTIWRRGGIDLCPGKKDQETSPVDIAASRQVLLLDRVTI